MIFPDRASLLGAEYERHKTGSVFHHEATFCSAQKLQEILESEGLKITQDRQTVLSHDGYEPVHKPLFQYLLDHYSVVSIPAWPHHPKDKLVAEATVKMVYTSMLAKLNGRSFPSKTAILKAWMAELHNVNTAPFIRLAPSLGAHSGSIPTCPLRYKNTGPPSKVIRYFYVGQVGIEPTTSWSRTKRATPALLPAEKKSRAQAGFGSDGD